MKIKLNTKYIYIASLFAVTFILYAFSMSFFPGGFVGTTRKNGENLGCVCHGDTASSIVSVVITGPDSVAAGQTVTYRVKASNGPAAVGGFNVACYRADKTDTLTLSPLTGDTTVRKQEGELTHAHPKMFNADTVSWQFTYTASNVLGYDTLYATANSTNDDTTSSNDNWNWSLNKIIRIYNPIGIINISSIAEGFSLSQNYPNPFNPVTQIIFSVGKTSNIELKVYDMLGNVVSVLVNENLKRGEYKTDFSSSGISSGTYFYTLSSDGRNISTKKMLFIK
jgi:hypothetical protein